jgi:hypothetical protein
MHSDTRPIDEEKHGSFPNCPGWIGFHFGGSTNRSLYAQKPHGANTAGSWFSLFINRGKEDLTQRKRTPRF